jgi:tripartite-type tricarboxylate transporter receptor subunit TctC
MQRPGMQGLGKALCALAAGLAIAASLVVPSMAQTSQNWPQRSVRFIVSLGPGSGADIGARLIADKLTAKWKQPVVVENRPGGDAVVAINAFIGAKDDHTLLYTPTSSFTAHPYQHAKLPYDPAELTPVTRISNTLVGFVVPSSLKVNSVKDFVDMVQGYIGALAIVQPHVQSGRAKLIAVTNEVRAPSQPDTPTVTQAGFPAMTFDGLTGLFGQRSMPDALRNQIAADVKEVMADPAIASRFNATGQLVSPGTAADFAASIKDQQMKLAAIAKELGVKPQ